MGYFGSFGCLKYPLRLGETEVWFLKLGCPCPLSRGQMLIPLGNQHLDLTNLSISGPWESEMFPLLWTLPMEGLSSVLYQFYHGPILPNC